CGAVSTRWSGGPGSGRVGARVWRTARASDLRSFPSSPTPARMPGMNDQEILHPSAALRETLPHPPPAGASFRPRLVTGSMAYVAGQVPMVDGSILHPGIVGDRVSAEEAARAARRCGLQALAALRAGLGGSFDRLERIVQVTVFVSAVPGFVDHP